MIILKIIGLLVIAFCFAVIEALMLLQISLIKSHKIRALGYTGAVVIFALALAVGLTWFQSIMALLIN